MSRERIPINSVDDSYRLRQAIGAIMSAVVWVLDYWALLFMGHFD